MVNHSLNFKGWETEVGKFDGGYVSTDGGTLLLREVEARTGMIRELADCFTDNRDPSRIKHTVEELVAQRVYGLALGYEDLDDHDRLRTDPLLALAVGKTDLTGENRRSAEYRGKALAGKSTLNRLELSSQKSDRYKRTPVSVDRIRETLVSTFIRITEMKEGIPKRLILDIDATDDIIHGEQEGKFFHAYYNNYCYLPLYIFCNGHPLCAKLRRSCIDPAKGSVEEFEYIIGRLRARWPNVRILIRGDSGFSRDYIMSWCEDNKVDYILGVAKNIRLKKIIGRQLYVARKRYEETGKAARVFTWFWYKTRKSWRQEKRVIGKAEHLNKGSNPQFIVTSLPDSDRKLYEQVYCARGEMENRIKEQQLDLFADRTSTHYMSSNQLRLWFSTFACILLSTFRVLGIEGTSFARAQCGTIRLKLLKIGAVLRFSVRRVLVSFSCGYPWSDEYSIIHRKIRSIPLRA
ncbi:IS1380 family transposase [Candidatus Fermentibacteria bacterium]|nr:MAG: IS1380 family transposase [Candidatus Fermentibacteria bacterium]